MNPGTLVVVNFQGVVGTKRRPAVVISSEFYHNERPDVIVALVTSQVSKATSKTDHVLKDWKLAGLDKPSAVRLFLQTYPSDKCSKIGSLSNDDWIEIASLLKVSIAF